MKIINYLIIIETLSLWKVQVNVNHQNNCPDYVTISKLLLFICQLKKRMSEINRFKLECWNVNTTQTIPVTQWKYAINLLCSFIPVEKVLPVSPIYC